MTSHAAVGREVTGTARGPRAFARRFARSLLKRRQLYKQAALYFGAYLIYSLARWAVAGEYTVALANAQMIVDLERAVGFDLEDDLQRALLGSWAMPALNRLYLSAQGIVAPITLFALYRWAPPAYRRLRDTLLATWLLALPAYMFFPCAPPRLAGIGMVDTVSSGTAVALDSNLATAFYNPFAAVPSLHVGFAFAIGLIVAHATRSRAIRVVALAWGPIVLITVVATGNHFFFDALAGLIATALGFAIGETVARGRRRDRSAAAAGPA